MGGSKKSYPPASSSAALPSKQKVTASSSSTPKAMPSSATATRADSSSQPPPPPPPPPAVSAEDSAAAVEAAVCASAAEAMVGEHAASFIARNGPDASFESWVASLHPENVTIDPRLSLPASRHRTIWDAAVVAAADATVVAAADPDAIAGGRGAGGVVNAPTARRQVGLIEGTLGCVFHTNVYLMSTILACARAPFELGADSALRRANGGGSGVCALLRPFFFLFGFVFRIVATSLAFAEMCAVYSVQLAAAIVLGTLSVSPATGVHAFRDLSDSSVAAYAVLAKGGAKVARPSAALAHTFSGCFKANPEERPQLAMPSQLSPKLAKRQQNALAGCSTDPLPVVVGVPVALEEP